MNNRLIEELLGHVVKNSSESAEKLMGYFGSYAGIVEAEPEEIRDALGGDMSTALYIKLAVSL